MIARQFIRKNSIFFAIGLTILLIFASALLTFYGRYQAKHFNSTKEQVEKVNERLDNVFAYLNDMDKGVRGFLIVPDDQFLYPYSRVARNMNPNFDTLQMILDRQGFPNVQGLAKPKAVLNEYYKVTLDNVITLKREGNQQAALAIYQDDPGYPVFMTY